jgi:hypothetical protein
MSNFEAFNYFQDKIKAESIRFEKSRKESENRILKFLKMGLTGLLEPYTFIKGVIWTQYTPSFNDSDPCTMFVCREGFVFSNDTTWIFEEYDLVMEDLPVEVTEELLNDLSNKFESILHSVSRESKENIFGTNYEITVSRDGSISKRWTDYGN